jgi:hypothetical protein
MLKIYYHKKRYLLPENFNELTGKQLVKLAHLTGASTGHERRVLQILLNKNSLSFALIPVDVKWRLLRFIDWVFAANTLTAQLIPKYKGFVGAKGDFDNLTLSEFHFTELFYKMMVNGDETAACKLIAVLYRLPKKRYNYKKDSDGDARREFNSNEIDFYSKIIDKKFSPAVKTAVVMWYDGCRQNLIELYDKAFSAPGAQEDADEFGMYNMIRNLSGATFGPIKEVEKIFVHSAFVEVEKIMEDNERMEREMKKIK